MVRSIFKTSAFRSRTLMSDPMCLEWSVGLLTSYFSLLLSALRPRWSRWCEICLLCITELMHSEGLKCAGEARLVFKFHRVFCSKGDALLWLLPRGLDEPSC